MRFTTVEKRASSVSCSGLSMGLIDFLRNKTKTAETAKNRLQIIIAQERTKRGGPDYLPLLQRELLEVIKNT